MTTSTVGQRSVAWRTKPRDGVSAPTRDAPNRPALSPGDAAICTGTVFHRRTMPTHHEFAAPVGYVWIDPDRPDALCARHPLWSASRPAPARFRRRDYGLRPDGSLTDDVRADLAPVLGERPSGAVRMFTQVRRFGWLFNPITVYLAWVDDADDPVGAVLEVTNTPWKERVRYPVRLRRDGDWLTATTDKVLHVSPFLDESHRYDIRVRGGDDEFEFGIDVVSDGFDRPILVTGVTTGRAPATRRGLTRALVRPALSTHRVSWGIHWQALKLWWKRVPFVPHPRKREVTPVSEPTGGRSRAEDEHGDAR